MTLSQRIAAGRVATVKAEQAFQTVPTVTRSPFVARFLEAQAEGKRQALPGSAFGAWAYAATDRSQQS